MYIIGGRGGEGCRFPTRETIDLAEEIDNLRNVQQSVFEDVEAYNASNLQPAGIINILHVNVRSYNKHIDELLVILNNFSVKFNIIILTETWTDISNLTINIDGFDTIVNTHKRNQNDGVVVYVSRSLGVTHEEVSFHGATSIKLDITSGREKHSVLALYRSPSNERDFDLFLNDLERYSCDMSGGITRWIVGDINCCILPESDNALSQRYLDILYTAGFVSCVNTPTRVTPFTKSCIDHIFVDIKNTHSVKSAVIKLDMTDHYFITASKTLTDSTTPKRKTKYVKRLDEKQANHLIAQHDWTSVLQEQDINKSAEIFVINLQEIINNSTSTIKISAKNYKIKPWITCGLVKSIRHRDKLSKQIKGQPFNTKLINEYKNYRNTLNNVIKQTKEQYYRDRIRDSQNDPRKLWENIKEMSGTKINKESFPLDHFTDESNVTDTTIKQIANQFNEYYTGVGAELANKIPHLHTPTYEDREFRADTPFRLQPVSEEELGQCIRHMKGTSAPGIDNIPANMIKNNFEYLRYPLLHVINNSINKGIFPKCFKIGKVIPIFKSGERKNFANYRPINLSSVLAKILERCVKNQLCKYVYEQNILSDNQFGFRSDKKINDDLFNLTNEIHKIIGANRKTLLIFIDLAKAFDVIDRSLLIKKLKLIGVRGLSLDWFKSYLTDREQVVSIQGVNSNTQHNNYGVIQGSALGPILFLIYINNLGKLKLESGKMFLYADDTALLFEGKSWEDVYRKSESGLCIVKQWFDLNRLTINVKKTKYMAVSMRADHDPIDLSLRIHSCGNTDNCTTCPMVDQVSEYKYLGIMFDNRLKWGSHISYIRRKLRKFIWVFKTLGRILPQELLKNVYYAYVQSTIEYGIIAWGGSYKSTIAPLLITQKGIMKAALQKDRSYSSDAIYNDFRVFDVGQLYVRTIILFIFRNKSDLFNKITHTYATRTAINIGTILPRITKTINRTNSHYVASIVYKKLPYQLANPGTCTLATYKKNVNDWLRNLGRSAASMLTHSEYTQ